MRPQARVNSLVPRGADVLRERDFAAAADALAERAQPVGGSGAVAGEAAAFATGCRLAAIVQRACKVPSRCSSAFEVFCAAGSDELLVLPGAAA